MSSTFRSRVVVLAVALAVWGRGEIASATPISDPAGDFVATFLGAHHGAFDVISADGTFDGTTFHLSAILAAAVSAAPAGSVPLYVWGINTGTGVLNFANIGNPNVQFNTVATLNAAGVTSNPAFLGSINGNLIAIDIPLSALPPSTGFAPADYLWNLWPRDTAAPVAPARSGTPQPSRTSRPTTQWRASPRSLSRRRSACSGSASPARLAAPCTDGNAPPEAGVASATSKGCFGALSHHLRIFPRRERTDSHQVVPQADVIAIWLPRAEGGHYGRLARRAWRRLFLFAERGKQGSQQRRRLLMP